MGPEPNEAANGRPVQTPSGQPKLVEVGGFFHLPSLVALVASLCLAVPAGYFLMSYRYRDNYAGLK